MRRTLPYHRRHFLGREPATQARDHHGDDFALAAAERLSGNRAGGATGA